MKINFKHELKPGGKLSEKNLIDLLLANRKIKDKKEFLNPTSPLKISITDFGFKKELKKTLKLLEDIKKKDQMIVVYTDYDADGITGGAILWETLFLLGFKVMPYVPHRKLEGYGFSIKGIDAVKKLYNPALIISVDHGITAKEKVTYAKKLGIPIIITDHHLKPEKLPDDAVAIFHIPLLSGSGVAYFFAKEVYEHFKLESSKVESLKSNFSTDYLALASIGSIADLVPLVGPTRSVVKHGLAAFLKIKRIGLKQIIKESGIEGKKITPYEVGFIIAPRINAVGRLEHAIDALRLLCTTSEKKASRLAGSIGIKNRERQDLVKIAVEEAKKMVEKIRVKPVELKKNGAKYADLTTLTNDSNSKSLRVVSNTHTSDLPKLLILKNKSWHEGIIGLIASKITEAYYRPTIVFTESDKFLKASARSIPSFHITNFLRDLKEYLIDVGGHQGAAGFTMEKAKFDQFVKKAQAEAAKLITDKDLERKIEVDLKTPIAPVSIKLVKALEALEPFGIDNPRPTFYSQAELVDAKLFGRTNDHMKIMVKDPGKESNFLELISFYSSDQFNQLFRGQKINVVYSLEINNWNNKLQGRLISII